MRITGGKYCGRRILVKRNLNARPAMSIVRESIFNMLNSSVCMLDYVVLDLYCGTGSLAFEALSRGAEHAFFVDVNYGNLKFIKETAASLSLINNITTICCKVEKLPVATRKCDLVFIDPPYKDHNCIEGILKSLIDKIWLNDNSLAVIESQKDCLMKLPERYTVLRQRHYGATTITILEYKCRDQ